MYIHRSIQEDPPEWLPAFGSKTASNSVRRYNVAELHGRETDAASRDEEPQLFLNCLGEWSSVNCIG
jgi:hypothetical protein